MINNNRVDDDLNDLAKSYLNQRQNVYPAAGSIPTNVSSTNTATGTTASPGPSGFGGATRPGRRTFNPLSQLASYTYQLTLYLLTPSAYNQFCQNGRQRINAFNTTTFEGSNIEEGTFIVAQSAGINDSTQGRAPGFELDYFIDDFKWSAGMSTQATTVSTSLNHNITFKIIEPTGFSFLTNLRTAVKAVEQAAKATEASDVNAWKQHYVVGIRFYGYDDDGKVVLPTTEIDGQQIDPIGTDCLFESFHDIIITDVKFKLGTGGSSTYEVTATGTNSDILLNIKRGRTPTTFNIKGYTVKDALLDFEKQLNEYQEDLKKSTKASDYPKNTYKFTFAPDTGLLQDAKLATETTRNRFGYVPTTAANTGESTEVKSQEKPNYGLQRFTFSNDFPLVQAFDTIIKRSSYLENAMELIQKNKVEFVAEQDPSTPNAEANLGTNYPLTWYTVSANIRKATWNKYTCDWAYDIEYVFQLYSVPNLPTAYNSSFNIYYGPHKRYDYFLTGMNSEVLDLTLNFNNLYTQAVLNVDASLLSAGAQKNTDTEGRDSQANAPQGTAGSPGGLVQEPPPPGSATQPPNVTGGGNMSVMPGSPSNGPKDGNLGESGSDKTAILTYLTDNEAFANAKMTIIGDPDYFVRDSAKVIEDLYNRFYETDGYTINASAGQVFVEVAIKQALDYDESTGLVPLCQNFYYINHPKYIQDMTQGAMIFQVKMVHSSFTGGKFTQTLEMFAATFNGDKDYNEPLQSTNPPPIGVFKNNQWPNQSDAIGLNDDQNKFLAKLNNWANNQPRITLNDGSQIVDIFGRPQKLGSTPPVAPAVPFRPPT